MYKILGRDNTAKVIQKSLNKIPQEGLICNLDMQHIVGITVYDRSGNGNDGTTAYVTSSTGIKDVNHSTYYNGSLASCAIVNFFQSIDVSYTYELWFKVYPGWSNTTRIAAAYGGSSKGMILTYNSNKTLEVFSHGAQITTSETFDDGKWHHIVVCENNGDLNIVIDNDRKYTTSHSFIPFGDNQQLRLGASNAATLFWHGYIAAFRVWNRDLSAEEIKHLYNKGYGIK